MFVKRIDNDYSDPECVDSVIKYIFRSNGNACIFTGGLNVLDPLDTASEFNMVRCFYRKTTGTQLRHYVISVEPRDMFIPYMCAELAYQICAYYASEYQTVFSVHTNTRFMHIHIVVNTVSFVTGKKLHEGLGDFKRFEKHCHKCYARVKAKYSYIKKELGSF